MENLKISWRRKLWFKLLLVVAWVFSCLPLKSHKNADDIYTTF